VPSSSSCAAGSKPSTKLTDALLANAKLRDQAERLIAAYVEPESNRAAIINDLIALLDGPQQREARRLAHEAMGEDFGNNA
jgi:hypothetical protein